MKQDYKFNLNLLSFVAENIYSIALPSDAYAPESRQTLSVTSHALGTAQGHPSANRGDRTEKNAPRTERDYGGAKVAVCCPEFDPTDPI